MPSSSTPTGPAAEFREHGGLTWPVYFYEHGRHTIWGATASILKQLLDLLPEDEKKNIQEKNPQST